MNQHARIAGRIVGVLAVTWTLGFAFVQFGQRALGGWPASEIGELLACIAGTTLAIALRARLAAYLCAAMVAFSAAELIIHGVYGLRAAQGAPTHFAVMLAAMLAVVSGATLARHPVSPGVR